MPRIATSNLPSVCGTRFEELPTDVLEHIALLYYIPTQDELCERVYQKTMAMRERCINEGELETYELTFFDSEDQEEISNTRHSFHELDSSVSGVYTYLTLTIRKHIICHTTWKQRDELFDYYFKDTKQASRYLKNDRYAIVGYYENELFYNEEEATKDETDESIFKADCLCKLLLESFHERYKCVLDINNKVEDFDGEYCLYATFKRLDDGEEPEDASEYFAELHERYK